MFQEKITPPKFLISRSINLCASSSESTIKACRCLSFITKGKEGEKPAFKKYVPLAGLDFDIDVDNPKMGGSGVPVVETKPRRQTVKRTSGFQVKDLDPKIKKGRGALGDETRIATNTYAQAVAKINNTIRYVIFIFF